MSAALSPDQAGKIRDAVRLVRYGGILAFVALIASFVFEPAIYLFALGPVAFGILAVVSFPLLRPAGFAFAVIVAAIGLGAAIVETAGVIAPSSGTHLRISPIFGAGTIGLGAWFVGLSALTRFAGTVPLDVTAKLARGGIGFALIGAFWFIEDSTVGLAVLGIGAILSGGVNPLIKYLRTVGLPPAPAPVPDGLTVAHEAIGRE